MTTGRDPVSISFSVSLSANGLQLFTHNNDESDGTRVCNCLQSDNIIMTQQQSNVSFIRTYHYLYSVMYASRNSLPFSVMLRCYDMYLYRIAFLYMRCCIKVTSYMPFFIITSSLIFTYLSLVHFD